MSIVSRALVFAAEHHQHQLRKGTRVPYMYHLLNVCKILVDHDCDDEVLAAGLLHDVVEDTPVTIEEVELHFGTRVASLVRAATELDKLEKRSIDKKGSWAERKQETINFLEHDASLLELKVPAADKLDNLRSMAADHARLGDVIWERFSASKEQQAWYFGEITRIFNERGKDEPMLQAIAEELALLHKRVF
ncbi:HD domain-containing protein [Flavihumibacter rivuli]|uniref:HD domain-containing protein n=1 Tax=Flavihumibacter rivuli TaxID=2838156 RepID=UPI001BDDF291|nr:HD domain-containing protein [Flavihumibacter rivuli]ULQ55812.1 HD domain-containing protein [Flavihumibacter rivuli]